MRRPPPVGDVELHRPPAAAHEVERMIGGGGGGEGGLLPVDRGEQQPVDAEHALSLGVDRVEARLPGGGDVHFGLAEQTARIAAAAGAGRVRNHSPSGSDIPRRPLRGSSARSFSSGASPAGGSPPTARAGQCGVGPGRDTPSGEQRRLGGAGRSGRGGIREHRGRGGDSGTRRGAHSARQHRPEHAGAEQAEREREQPSPPFRGRGG